jgi:hypothetical protein
MESFLPADCVIGNSPLSVGRAYTNQRENPACWRRSPPGYSDWQLQVTWVAVAGAFLEASARQGQHEEKEARGSQCSSHRPFMVPSRRANVPTLGIVQRFIVDITLVE